jgi:hypothetical protein
VNVWTVFNSLAQDKVQEAKSSAQGSESFTLVMGEEFLCHQSKYQHLKEYL